MQLPFILDVDIQVLGTGLVQSTGRLLKERRFQEAIAHTILCRDTLQKLR